MKISMIIKIFTLALLLNCIDIIKSDDTFPVNWENVAKICDVRENRTELNQHLKTIACNISHPQCGSGSIYNDGSGDEEEHLPTCFPMVNDDDDDNSHCCGYDENAFSEFTKKYWYKEIDEEGEAPKIKSFIITTKDPGDIKRKGNIFIMKKADTIWFKGEIEGRSKPNITIYSINQNAEKINLNIKISLNSNKFSERFTTGTIGSQYFTYNKFQLKAENEFGIAVSDFLKVLNYREFLYDGNGTNLSVIKNEHKVLKFTFEKYIPVLDLLWYQPKTRNIIENDENAINVGKSLIIVNAKIPGKYIAVWDPVFRNMKNTGYIFFLRYNLKIKNSTTQQVKFERLFPFDNGDSYKIAVVGEQNYKMYCVFRASSTPLIEWNVPNKLDNISMVEKANYNRILKIEKVEKKHEGKYKCIGNFEGESLSYTFNLRVRQKPKLIFFKSQTVDDEAENVKFVCNTTGDPKPYVHWYINGQKINEHVLSMNKTVQTHDNVLTFTKVSKETRVMVQCNATNMFGYVFENAFLRVLTLKPILYSSLTQPISRAVFLQTFVFYTMVFGSPKPNATYIKVEKEEDIEEVKIGILKQDSLISVTNNCNKKDRYLACLFETKQYNFSFAVKNLKPSDAGIYLAFFNNKFGKAYEKITLQVFKNTNVTIYNETDGNILANNVFPIETSMLEINCKPDADENLRDEVKIQWMVKDNNNFVPVKSNNNNISIKQNDKLKSILQFKSLSTQNSGEYLCLVKTSLENVRKMFSISVLGKPEQPESFKVDNCQDGLHPILIIKPGNENGASITKYVLNYKQTMKSRPYIEKYESIEINSKEFDEQLDQYIKYEVTNLRLDSSFQYEFDLKAINSFGPSLKVSFSNCNLNDKKPEKTPNKICSKNSEKHDVLDLNWIDILDSETNGKGFHYKILIKYNSKTYAITQFYGEHLTVKNHKDLNIEPFSKYKVTIRSQNDKGKAQESDVFEIYSPEGKMDPEKAKVKNIQFKNMESIDNITVTFDPIGKTKEEINEAMNGILKGYYLEVKYSEEDKQEFELKMPYKDHYECSLTKRKKRQVNDLASHEMTLQDLKPYKDASLTIAATNLRGDRGPSSDSVSFKTPAGPPFNGKEPPTDCETGPYHVKCLANKPDGDRGGIPGDTIICVKLKENDLNCICKKNYSPEENKIECTDGLSICTNYVVLITMTNKLSENSNTLIYGKPSITYLKTNCTVSPLKNIRGSGYHPDNFNYSTIKITWTLHGEGYEPTHFQLKYYFENYNNDTSGMNSTEIYSLPKSIILSDLIKDEPYMGILVGFVGETKENDFKNKSFVESPPFQFNTGDRKPPIFIKMSTEIVTTPQSAGAVKAGINMLLIYILLAIVLLLLLIILIICCYRYNRGGKYPVYEREKERGIPDNDNVSEDLKPFNTNNTQLLPRGGSEKNLLGSSDSDSLMEYDDTDPSKFNEDGSFIGQYGGDKIPETPDINPLPNALSTFV